MKLIIYGCGGHARSIINTIIENGGRPGILIVDDNAKLNEKIMGVSVVRDYILQKDNKYIVAVGNNEERKGIYDKLKYWPDGECISIVSHLSYIGKETDIGRGTFIASYAYVGPQVKIGSGTIINTGSIVEHETVVGNYSHIAPHATVCGRVRLGSNVFCGAGSTVIDHISICDNVMIGAGAVVVKDIMESGTYVGIPARKVS